MRKVTLVLGIFFIVLAVIVLLFANGPRRWYSGVFFAIIGTVTFAERSAVASQLRRVKPIL